VGVGAGALRGVQGSGGVTELRSIDSVRIGTLIDGFQNRCSRVSCADCGGWSDTEPAAVCGVSRSFWVRLGSGAIACCQRGGREFGEFICAPKPANQGIGGGSEFRGCLSTVSWDPLEEIRQRAPEVEGTWELVVGEEAFEVLRSRSSYSELLENIRENGELDLYVYGGEFPFSVWMYDDMVQVGIEDEEGIPRAVVESRMVRFGSGGGRVRAATTGGCGVVGVRFVAHGLCAA